MVETAVKVMLLPAHIVAFGVEMLTVGVTAGKTVMVMALEVAGLLVTQLSEDVITQLITSFVTNVLVE